MDDATEEDVDLGWKTAQEKSNKTKRRKSVAQDVGIDGAAEEERKEAAAVRLDYCSHLAGSDLPCRKTGHGYSRSSQHVFSETDNCAMRRGSSRCRSLSWGRAQRGSSEESRKWKMTRMAMRRTTMRLSDDPRKWTRRHGSRECTSGGSSVRSEGVLFLFARFSGVDSVHLFPDACRVSLLNAVSVKVHATFTRVSKSI